MGAEYDPLALEIDLCCCCGCPVRASQQLFALHGGLVWAVVYVTMMQSCPTMYREVIISEIVRCHLLNWAGMGRFVVMACLVADGS